MREQVCQPLITLLLQEDGLGGGRKSLDAGDVICPIPGQQVEHTLTGDSFHRRSLSGHILGGYVPDRSARFLDVQPAALDAGGD